MGRVIVSGIARPNGLLLHRSEQADALVEALGELLAEPPADPFTPDVVAVPTRGVERWVAQRLSHRLGVAPAADPDGSLGPDGEGGVCANVTFPSPGRLAADVLAAALGVNADDDPWRRDRLAWAVLDVADACAAQPWCAPLGRYLGVGENSDIPPLDGDPPGDGRRERRMRSAQHLAGLFDSYGSQRPVMLREWAAHGVTHPDEPNRAGDGAGGWVPHDLGWQPELWRRVRARIGVPSPAERLERALQLLVDEPAAVDLPARLSVFGPTRLPADQLAILRALGVHRAVHLWLPHPSPELWRRVAELAPDASPGAGAGSETVPRRSQVATPARHPLLASMARDATELQLRLSAQGRAIVGTIQHPAGRPPATILGVLQSGLRADREPEPAQPEPSPGSAADRSVQLHVCHGRARQVEVLRELLLGLLQDDPTLEPRDVIVMCPDIETFAPLVVAAFGSAGPEDTHDSGHPGRSLRVQLADRSLRQTNPLLGLLGTVLDLADARVTASELIDLAGLGPVRRRFRFTGDDLDRVRSWAVKAGVHWGENHQRRERFRLGGVGQGTWATGLDRLLLGVAMADEDHRFIGPTLPLDDVASNDIVLAGRFAEFVERVGTVLDSLQGQHRAADWMDALDRALDLLSDLPPGVEWQALEARTVLAEARRSASTSLDGASALPLRLNDVRSVLARRLRGRPTRAGFRTGALTVCSLEPMRAVPHRVVCLLGMDDGAFPRASATDGDDVLLRDPLLGERDRRGEDRQLFLDAITSARETLVVLYGGADERTGALRPPAVPVSELLDAVPGALVVRHPLQTVDERNFTTAALGKPGPFSFDALSQRAAVAARRPRVPREPFLVGRVEVESPSAGTELDLDDLIAVLEHPVRAFVRRRLGVVLPGEVEDVVDRLPLRLESLESWQIGDRLLAAALSGDDLDQVLAAERRRGQVPPGALGTASLWDVAQRVDPIATASSALTRADAGSRDISLVLPGRSQAHSARVSGTVSAVHGDVLVRAVYSRLAAKHRLRAWVQLLALTAAFPGEIFTSVTVGRSAGRRPTATTSLLSAPPPAEAARLLADLVSVRDLALGEPLPLPPAASHAYARARAGGEPEASALEAARLGFVDSFESTDPFHRLVWGESVRLDDLLASPGEPVESTGHQEEPTRFGTLARRLWDPVLEHEQRVTT